MKKFKAAIFDMDGTLLDSMFIWRHLAPEYLRKNHIAVPDDLAEQMTIMGIHKAVDFLIANFGLKLSHDELHQELITILEDFYRLDACFKPGAIRFLQKLRERNVATMIFSATPQDLLHLVMDRLDAGQYFTHGLLSCDRINSSKHKDEAFFAAAEHIGFPRKDIMVFEDALYAATTVKRAGFTLGVMADREEKHVSEMRSLADFYMEESWDEFPVEQYF